MYPRSDYNKVIKIEAKGEIQPRKDRKPTVINAII